MTLMLKALLLIENSRACTYRNTRIDDTQSQECWPLPLRLLPSPRAMRRVLAICASVPSRFAQYPKRCSALVPAARRAATAARALVPRLERHESGAAGLWAERPPSTQPRIASMPTALPRRPKQARAMLIPFVLLTLILPPAPSQIQNNVGEAGVLR